MIFNNLVRSPRLTRRRTSVSSAGAPDVGLQAPRRPHGHRAPSASTTMCPISPAARDRATGGRRSPRRRPRRCHRRLPRTTRSHGRPRVPFPPAPPPARRCRDHRNAQRVGEGRSERVHAPIQSGRLPAWLTVPAATSICPGAPTRGPRCRRCRGLRPRPPAAPRRRSPPPRPGGPPVVGVGRRCSPSTRSKSSQSTAWIFVPPRSIPARTFMIRLQSDRRRQLLPPAPPNVRRSPNSGGSPRVRGPSSPARGLKTKIQASTAIAAKKPNDTAPPTFSIAVRKKFAMIQLATRSAVSMADEPYARSRAGNASEDRPTPAPRNRTRSRR